MPLLPEARSVDTLRAIAVIFQTAAAIDWHPATTANVTHQKWSRKRYRQARKARAEYQRAAAIVPVYTTQELL